MRALNAEPKVGFNYCCKNDLSKDPLQFQQARNLWNESITSRVGKDRLKLLEVTGPHLVVFLKRCHQQVIPTPSQQPSEKTRISR